MNTWDKLSMREKAKYIKVGVKNGLTNVEDISKTYNSFAEGGPLGGYEEDTLEKRKSLANKWDPTGSFKPLSGLISQYLLKGNPTGEEQAYYNTYLGLENNLPKMNPKAKTEWDDEIEAAKVTNNELPSEFYGTTPRMDASIQAIADTLNTGKILRNYKEYKKAVPNLPSKAVIQEIYDTGKNVMDNPNKWQPVDGDYATIRRKYDRATQEDNPLGMLGNFGMKWDPEAKTIYVHDTYDFPKRLVGPDKPMIERPREMKIRGAIKFNPQDGSILLRNNLEKYNQEIPSIRGSRDFADGGAVNNKTNQETSIQSNNYKVQFPQSPSDIPTWRRLYNLDKRRSFAPYSLEYIQEVENRVDTQPTNYKDYKDRNNALAEYKNIYGVFPLVEKDNIESLDRYSKTPAESYIQERAIQEEFNALELADKYSIPYDKNKEFKLQVGKDKGIKVSMPLLDSLAKYGAQANLPIEEALGLSSTETGLGYYQPYTYESIIPTLEDGEGYYSTNGKISPAGVINYETAFYRNNPFSKSLGELKRKNASEKEMEKEAIRLDKLQYKGPKDENPLKAGFLFYKSGKYNPGELSHSGKVRRNGEILMTDPTIKKWWKERGKNYYENN